MNDPQWVEAARKLGERAVKAAPGREARLDFLARTTLARSLGKTELEALDRSAAKIATRLQADPAGAKDLLAVGESKSDPAIAPGELAEWTLIASQFLNLDEFLNK